MDHQRDRFVLTAILQAIASGVGVGNDTFTKILLHMDGVNGGTTFTDINAGGSVHTWTAHTATTDTSLFKFGVSAGNFGTTGWIDTPDNTDFTLGAADWTVDCWFNRSGGDGTSRRLFGQMNSGATVLSVSGGLNTSNQCFLQAHNGSIILVAGTTAITATGWNHFAGVRTGNVLRMFVNGVQEGGDVAFTGTTTDSTDTFSVGRSGALTTSIWNGSIDEFRLSAGIARWTANFTPPTGQYG